MDVVLVRHGESTANAEGRLQGRRDYPLSALGIEQSNALGAWMAALALPVAAILSSPLTRAWETARIVASALGSVEPEPVPELCEIAMGELEGMARETIAQRHPEYLQRSLFDVGNFARYGGESYDEVQARAASFREIMQARFSASETCVVLVGHGGFNYQLLKQLICTPVPRVCIVTMSNCAATMVRLRRRREVYLGELVWHVPVGLLGAPPGSHDAAAIVA
ncbi:MAG TPA: histidine phosphatase family protein [Polyangiaceae bacterium]|jgi:broad specificity phosphatase PhoE